MRRNLLSAIAVVMVVGLSLLGCELISTALAPAPTATVQSRPTAVSNATTSASTSSQPTSAPPTVATAQTNYNGEWKGKSSTDSTIAFTVQDNQISDISANYNGPAGTCRSLSLSYSNSVKDAPIKGKDVTARADFRDGAQVTLTGTFASNAEASGSVTFKGKFEGCGDYEVKATWTARSSSAPSGGVNPPPSSRPTAGASTSGDAEKTLRSFFDAINAKQVDAALALVADDIVFTSGSTAIIGKEQLQTYLSGQASRGVTYVFSNAQVVGGDTATFSIKIGTGAVTNGNSATLDDGKIEILTLR